MLVRDWTLSTCSAALLVALCVGGAGAEGNQPLAGDSPDSSSAVVVSPVAGARDAYQAAWAQRQAGDYAAAIRTAEAAVSEIDAQLTGDLDASSRRDLTEFRARLTGLKDAAARDETAASAAAASGNEADEQVFNAPAVDAIQAQMNADVYKYIEYFSGAGRSTFERWLKRSGRYMDLFRSVLQNEGLPPDLVHLVFVESGFNLHARSSAAAVGPWQFLRSTGRLFGLTVNQWVDERKDPEKSTVAAARYLKHLYSIFGDWPLALASYNAGEGTVLRAIKRQGTTNYWDLRLPRQTEDYVPQFMAVLAISRNPAKYGFDDVELDDPLEFDEVALRGAVNLSAIAKLSDCSVQELRDLNPAVLRNAAQGRDGVTTLRVPRGKGEVLIDRIEDGAKLPAVSLELKHRVRRGETLSGIGAKYHVSARELALANGIGRKNVLRAGGLLTIPAGLKAPPPQVIDTKDPRASTAYVPQRARTPMTTLKAESRAEGRLTVTLRRGETLSMIADRYDVSVDDIMKWNRLSSTTVRRGTRLKIRTGSAAEFEPSRRDSMMIARIPAPSISRSSRAHMRVRATVVVQPGDTLGEIAQRHGTTVTKLKRVNGLSTSRIRAGQQLKIPV